MKPGKARSPGRGSFGIPGQELKALLRINTGYVLGKTALLAGIWIMLGWTVLQVNLWWKLPLWILMGFFINGLVQMSHETWHGNYLPKRWQNTVAGHLLSLLVGIAFEPLRHDHLAHHKFNRTEKDPDAYNAGQRSLGLSLLFYAVVVFGLPLSLIYFNVLYPIQHFTRREMARHILVLSLYASLYTALYVLLDTTNHLNTALQVWIVPILFTSPFNGLKSIADHHNNLWKGNRFQTATTTRSNFLVTFVWNGLNYHLDHHLFPRIPGYNLPALHQKIRDHLQAQNAPLYDGYPGVMLAALRAGPQIVEEEVKLVTLARKNQNR